MNLKDMTDAQLNKAVAQIVGWESSDPCCEPENYNCLDRVKGQDCGKSSCRYYRPGALQPPDYCSSPEAGAELKRWLRAKKMPHGMHLEPFNDMYFWEVGRATVYNDRELRALAEGVVMTFGKLLGKTDSS